MPEDFNQELTEGIDDYLLAIADGVAEAQALLEEFAAEHPNATSHYRIPKVDFELKLNLELSKITSPTTSSNKNVPAKSGSTRIVTRNIPNLKFKMKALPIQAEASRSAKSGSFRESATSTLSGSIVAVPPRGGAPAPVLIARLEKVEGEANQIRAVARIENTAGEPLAHEKVEFNLNRTESQALNKEEGIIDTKTKEGKMPLPSSDFQKVQKYSDAHGIAESIFQFAPEEPEEASFVLEFMSAGVLIKKIYTKA